MHHVQTANLYSYFKEDEREDDCFHLIFESQHPDTLVLTTSNSIRHAISAPRHLSPYDF